MITTQFDSYIQYVVDSINSLSLKDKYSKMIEDKLPSTYNDFDKNKKKNVKRKIKKKCNNLLIDFIKESLDLTSEASIPDFILDEENIKCKLIDLGNSEVLGINNEDEIMIRSYRPPENIMNNFYNEKADIWTIGCIVYELLTGDYLFDIDRDLCDNDKDKQHLHQMYEILGKIPKDMALECEYTDELFDNQGRILNLKKCDYTSLEEIFKNDFNYTEKNAKETSEFLKHILDYNIKTRYSATKALNDIYLN
jgi:serine/threonine protein kinase